MLIIALDFDLSCNLHQWCDNYCISIGLSGQLITDFLKIISLNVLVNFNNL